MPAAVASIRPLIGIENAWTKSTTPRPSSASISSSAIRRASPVQASCTAREANIDCSSLRYGP